MRTAHALALSSRVWLARPCVRIHFQYGVNIDTGERLASVEKIIENMRANPRNVRFQDAVKVATHYFGEPRISAVERINAPGR